MRERIETTLNRTLSAQRYKDAEKGCRDTWEGTSERGTRPSTAANDGFASWWLQRWLRDVWLGDAGDESQARRAGRRAARSPASVELPLLPERKSSLKDSHERSVWPISNIMEQLQRCLAPCPGRPALEVGLLNGILLVNLRGFECQGLGGA